MTTFTAEENKLINHAKERYTQLRKLWRSKGLNDNYYACILSDSGKMYEAVPFVPPGGLGISETCCERVAMANMCTAETEKARVKIVLVMGPVGRGGLMTPCGLCRHAIYNMSDGKATVLCAGEYFESTQKDLGFLFKKMKKYTIKQLYPFPWSDGVWK